MKPEIGLCVRDANLNLYKIVDCRSNGNTHSQRPYDWLVECLKGPNVGRTMWIGESTIVNGNFPVSED